MGFLEKIDTWILDGVFQPAADYITEQTGKSCFWVAKVFAWAAVVASLLEVALTREWTLLPFRAVMLGFVIPYIYRLEKREASRRPEDRVMNSQRIFFPYGWVRLYFLASGFVGILLEVDKYGSRDAFWPLICATLYYVFLIVSYFFSCCTPKPPHVLRTGNLAAARI